MCECVTVRRPGRVLRLQKRETPTFCLVLVWVYFVHERFESGFRDLTLCVKVLPNKGFRAISTVQASPIGSNSNAICHHCLANHHRITSTNTAIANRCSPRSIHNGDRFCTIQAQTERSPHPSRKQGFPHRGREPYILRENRGFRAISTFQASLTKHVDSSLHISSRLFSSSHLFTSLHISSHLFTSLHISSHLFTSLHISSHLFTSPLSSHPYFTFPLSVSRSLDI